MEELRNECLHKSLTLSLHLACCGGHIEVVRYLIGIGGRISFRDRWGNTPLDDAKTYG